MEKDINLAVEDFKQNLTSTINSCGLPISVIYYVVTDLYKEIDAQYYNYIERARAALLSQAEAAAPAPQQQEEKEEEIGEED